MTFGVAIIGAGLIGRKRARAVCNDAHSTLRVVADIDKNRAQSLASEFGGEVETDWRRVVTREDIAIVVVSTFNKFLAPISIASLTNGKHVLCEKPLGRTAVESRAMIDAARDAGRILKPGFNHRYHKSIAKARQLLQSGAIGKLCFMRCRYGHGGRPGYNKEWRANRDLAGGGELVDQGVHVVDLFRWFAGDFHEVFGYTRTCFWDMEVEDNAFALFKTADGIIASMHTSCTQWKNIFSLEIFGTDGYLDIEGLGGSYGAKALRVGRQKPESGPPEEQIIEFDDNDESWGEEWQELISAIREGREPVGNAWDGYMANRMIEAVYRSSEIGRALRIEQSKHPVG